MKAITVIETQKKCFIIMPISTPENWMQKYLGDKDHFQHVLDHLLMPAIKKAGFEPISPKTKGSELIHGEIIRNIESADFVLCDMSILNPNVFFELGIRTSLNKPVCIIRDDLTENVPFDTSIINNHKYSSVLNPWTLDKEIEVLANHIKDSFEKCQDSNSLWKYFGLSSSAQPIEEEDSSAKFDFLIKQVEALREQLAVSSKVTKYDKDITGHKKAEELYFENMRLEAADKAKREFLANISHELRTPLNASIGFSELLERNIGGELSEKQKLYVDSILTNNQFLLTLINDILDLTKIEAGKIELVPEKMSVPLTVNETLSLIKEKAMKHKVLLKTEFDPGLEFIEADKLRFKQILFNLLSNAVKFSKKEGGTVTIRTKKEGDMARFSITDTGIGIKEEDMGKLFKEFEQVSTGISKIYGGTGLGLAISKKLVELHGGTIMAESRYDEGSTFTFLLPIISKVFQKIG